MLRAYFDDSGTDAASRIVVVGGVLLYDEQHDLLKEVWDSILRRYGLPFFHLTRFKAGKKPPYSMMTDGNKEVLLDQLVRLMSVRIKMSFSCAIPVAAYNEVLTENEKKRYGDAYSIAAQMSWIVIRLWAERYGYNDPIPFIVESGTNGEEQLLAVFNKVVADPTMKRLYRLDSMICGAKNDFPGLQGADIIANSTHDLSTHYSTGGRTPSKWAGIVSDHIVRMGSHRQLIFDERLLRSETDNLNDHYSKCEPMKRGSTSR